MSASGSDSGGEEFYGLTQDMFLLAGNPNPVGLPYLRQVLSSGQDAEDRLSLLGSIEMSGGYSDEGSESELLPSAAPGYGATSPARPGVTLVWRELCATLTHKQSFYKRHFTSERPRITKVLNNVSGAVVGGSLLALMGSSGAGKTTLMNALAHRTSRSLHLCGQILLNGRPAGASMARLAGYVHQHDLFVGSLTVKEHLMFMARLRMDKSSTRADRVGRVTELMRELGLYKCRHTRIGVPNEDKSLSGGERKRLAFATEIMTDPPLLFCDEPTTGLDAYNARKLVRMMREMAARGKAIVCTIHQPSSDVFAMFDRVLLLAEGRLAYCGTTAGALTFLDGLGHKCPATFNPADFFIHTLAMLPNHENSSRAQIRRIADNFAVSEHAKEIERIISEQESLQFSQQGTEETDEVLDGIPQKPGWGVQLMLLTWRAFVDSYRNPAIHTLRILQKLLIAIVIGVCYSNIRLDQAGIQNVQGVLFTFITENTFPSLYGVLNIFPQELPLFLREHKNGIYRCDVYYVAKMISLIPGFIVDPVVFCSVCYWMVGLRRPAYSFLMTVLTIIFTANVASACGAMFSAMFESIPCIMLVLIPFDVVLLISGGLFINLRTMSPYISWVKYLSWFMYSNEALTVTQWNGVTNITCDASANLTCIHTGEEVISTNAFSSSHVPLDFAFLAVLYCAFHVLGFLGLYNRTRKS
ncbi:protein scarlet isoform X1 [Hyalella azteca]|uniref:Protein scarlet isoform X1 n=1 Tax=Hyalella azteca TaxID=294128 RepID=A0A8B7NSD6_HYAAZ|nr:protein scarlet isoform X1 [Hyalella azteca]